jgi:hypothetical protein
MSKEKIGIALIIIGLVLNFSTIKFPAAGLLQVLSARWESDCCFKFKILKKRNNKLINQFQSEITYKLK